jgi:hypothetical protein
MITMALTLAAIAMPATAGEIFGDLRVGDKYVKQAPIQMVCGSETVKATTDAEQNWDWSRPDRGPDSFPPPDNAEVFTAEEYR